MDELEAVATPKEIMLAAVAAGYLVGLGLRVVRHRIWRAGLAAGIRLGQVKLDTSGRQA